MIKKILLLLSLGVLLWSCNDNDDNERIIGYWQFSYSRVAEIAADRDVIPSISDDIRGFGDWDWEFFEDGVAYEYRNNDIWKYNYYVENGILWVTLRTSGATYLSVPIIIGHNTMSMFFDETFEMQNAYPYANIDIVTREAVFKR